MNLNAKTHDTISGICTGSYIDGWTKERLEIEKEIEIEMIEGSTKTEMKDGKEGIQWLRKYIYKRNTELGGRRQGSNKQNRLL